jgi:site-specific DNA-methyltransferase (adenine-specific)
MKYKDFIDKFGSDQQYKQWLWERIYETLTMQFSPEIFWLSWNIKWLSSVLGYLREFSCYEQRLFIWRFTFGQHRQTDCGNGFRPLLRMKLPYAQLYPDAIRVKSARQLKYNDKRANPKGRVPDDVWEFPRICGTFKERKKWHPCQHPKALLRRLVLFSTKPGDLVIDMFAGSGNMLETCRELGRACIGIEISKFYCKKIAEETGAVLESSGK